jgi:XTP/dITP diphosphohydrolase
MTQSSSENQSQAVLDAINHLIEVVAQLRSPQGGCPWDLQQTPQTLIPYIIEEAYEVVDAIKKNDQTQIVEELGDLLLQILFQAQIATEKQHFSLKEIAQGITEKMIRRHPHVFGDMEVENVDQVHQNWEEIKAKEKGQTLDQTQLLSYQLSRYSSSLPPLMASMKMSKKAALAGFEWDNIQQVWAKFHEELTEFEEALTTENKTHQQEELGDVLFTLINVARWYKLDPFEALQNTNQKFIDRLSQMEKLADRPLTEYSLPELDRFWDQAKKHLKSSNE